MLSLLSIQLVEHAGGEDRRPVRGEQHRGSEAYLLHLKWAVVRNQPLSVIIAALSSEFQSYHGRLHGALHLDVHQPRRVLVVGYGTTKQGIWYWIVKNLWPCGARAAGAKKATSGCSATSANRGASAVSPPIPSCPQLLRRRPTSHSPQLSYAWDAYQHILDK